MQTILTYLAILLTGLLMNAQNTIEVSISGFENNDGKARVALYDSEDTYLQTRFKGEVSTIENEVATVIFDDLPDGTYAIAVVHDEDNNGELNMLMGFYPTEDTGASNNAPANFGPPKWKDAKFEILNGEKVEQFIKL